MDRSGTTTLLTLDTEIRTKYISDLEDDYPDEQIEAVRNTFTFLVSNGAVTSQWKSLIICAKSLDVLFDVIYPLCDFPGPALQFLSLWWKARVNSGTEAEARRFKNRLDESYGTLSISDPRKAKLRHVEFIALPTCYLFDRPMPPVFGLKHLVLDTASTLYSLPKLHELLSSNLELQSLSISAVLSTRAEFEATTLRVHLPSLRSLSLEFDDREEWALAIIQMIDAPTVEHLRLVDRSGREPLHKVLRYIATGAPEGICPDASRVTYDIRCLSYGPVYPTLRDLDIEYIENVELQVVKDMLSAFPTVTRLSAYHPIFPVLSSPPWVLPNLDCINSAIPYGIDNVLRCRIEAGFPIRRVEIGEGNFGDPRGEWPESVDRVEYECRIRDDDSDTGIEPRRHSIWDTPDDELF